MFKKKFSDDEIRVKAHELWMAREGIGKTSDDDWNEAIEALKTERSLINLVLKWSGLKRFFEWTGFKEKKGWDFLQLLIVPAVLSGGALYLQDAAKQRDTKAADEKAKQDTLTKYFDQMADLLLKEKLLQSLRNPDSEIFIIGRSKTVTVLQSLDPARQHLVIQFLKSANLNGSGKYVSIRFLEMLYLKGFLKKGLLYHAQMSNTSLNNADLSDAHLVKANLSKADLSGANLSNTDLSDADLSETNLSNAKLIGADLWLANLIQVNLSNANLRDANLRDANLSNANLSGTNLGGTNFSNADLGGINLSNTNLWNANLSNAYLSAANLSNADLWNANLSNADLWLANLSNANLINVKLSFEQIEASCYWQNAKFSDDFRKQLDKSISQKGNPNCKTMWNGN
jgi:uncharacterized protein YjbI with pentapeptide repeats